MEQHGSGKTGSMPLLTSPKIAQNILFVGDIIIYQRASGPKLQGFFWLALLAICSALRSPVSSSLFPFLSIFSLFFDYFLENSRDPIIYSPMGRGLVTKEASWRGSAYEKPKRKKWGKKKKTKILFFESICFKLVDVDL